MELKQGDRVVVYRDPITRTRPEGVARIERDWGHGLFSVRFESEPEDVYSRLVMPTWSVCAWCKSFYDENGILIRRCSPEEYAVTQSHGICRECKTEQTTKRNMEGAQ